MALAIPAEVELIEVGPRDGLQSLPAFVPTALKVALINRLCATGLRCVEVTSFVHPRAVPQLADAEAVLAAVGKVPGVTRRALVPNRKGAERAAAAGVDELLALVTVSEHYCLKNQNMSVAQNLAAVAEVTAFARAVKIPVTFAVATAFVCPFAGVVPDQQSLGVVAQLVRLGARRLYLADTAGMADPVQVHRLLSRVRAEWPDLSVGLHLHNTNGLAMANVLAGLDAGVQFLEGAICGIGGGIVMPHDLPVGNVPTEDLAHLLQLMGVRTGVDLDALRETARWFAQAAGIRPHSHLLMTGTLADLLQKNLPS